MTGRAPKRRLAGSSGLVLAARRCAWHVGSINGPLIIPAGLVRRCPTVRRFAKQIYAKSFAAGEVITLWTQGN